MIDLLKLWVKDKIQLTIWVLTLILLPAILALKDDFFHTQVKTLILNNPILMAKLLLCTALICFALFLSLLRVVFNIKKLDKTNKFIDIKKIKLDKTSSLILHYLYNEKDGKYLDNIIDFAKLNTGDTRYNLDILKKHNLINSSMLSGPNGPYYISEHGRKYVSEIINNKL